MLLCYNVSMKTVTFSCRFCGAQKEIPSWYAGRYQTCGAPACVTQRRSEGGKKNAGKVASADTKAKISAAGKGRPQTPEHIAARTASRQSKGAWFANTPDIGERISAGRKAGKQADVRGPKNPMWQGGISKLRRGYRGGAAYTEWRLTVLARTGGLCERCGSDRFVIAHHIVSWHVAPSLRLEPENGIALCRHCHALEHKLGEGFPNAPGKWPDRPSITTILCRYCQKPRYVQTKNADDFSTCGSRECVKQRIRSGLIHRNDKGSANGNYRHGNWTKTEKVCEQCGTVFTGPARRRFCSPDCSHTHRRKSNHVQ